MDQTINELHRMPESRSREADFCETRQEIIRQHLKEILVDLHPREAAVVTMRFGLEDGIPHSLEETAEQFGVTRERIRQIDQKVLRKVLRPIRNRKRIRDFYSCQEG